MATSRHVQGRMENWRVERLQELPSAQDFASQVEHRNMPVLYESSIKHWPAFSKWHPAKGGLDYLRGIGNSEMVQAMLSTSGGTFYGDIRSHERVALLFGEYLDYATDVYIQSGPQSKEGQLNNDMKLNKCCAGHLPEGSQLYLAQAPMFNKDQQEISPLRALMPDIIMPSCLNSSLVTNINLWMSASESKSSTHYDPYHNMLCVVVGQKQVTLWPPSAAPLLYPYPLHGEASNHSSVDFVKPDNEAHPLASHAMKSCQVVKLLAGDALFIPEGWYHQVNSDSLTIAVNLWWPSSLALALNTHMDGYYLRRVVSSFCVRSMPTVLYKSLLDSEKKKIIRAAESCQARKELVDNVGATKHIDNLEAIKHTLSDNQKVPQSNVEQAEVITHDFQLDDTQKGNDIERKEAFELLTPLQKQCLQCLVLACTRGDNVSAAVEQPGKLSLDSAQNLEIATSVATSPFLQQNALFSIQGEKIAQVFSILDPLALKQVLLVMANYFPRTLEVLIVNKLSPLASEVLTSKFDEMDSVFTESEQGEFYKTFYSIFEDPKLAMSALLDGKEAFSAMALKSVLEGYLGVAVR